jgi:hypothetical protein
MVLITTSSQQVDLEAVRTQFEDWRQSRDKRSPIPESLWKAAASLSPASSLTRISKSLRLNHTQLKHFVKALSPEPSMAVAEHFINLGIATPASQCMVEMRHPDGKCMSVQGLNSRDLINIARLFWSRP